MGYEDIKSGITKVLQDTKEKTIKVKEEIISCENGHPIVYINVPFGKIMRCPYCNLEYERIKSVSYTHLTLPTKNEV